MRSDTWPTPGHDAPEGSRYDPVAFGGLQSDVATLKAGQGEIKADIKLILAYIEHQKGAKWALGTVAGVVGAGVTHFLHLFTGTPK